MNLRLKNSRSLLFIAIGLITATVVAIATLTVLNKSSVSVPQSVSNSVDFKVVVPKHIPKKTSVDTAPKYEADEKVVITSFKTSDGASIVISQQKKPDIGLKQVDAKETYLAPVGSVYVLKGEANQIQAIVETEDSWVMVNCDQSIGIVACKSVIADLTVKN